MPEYDDLPDDDGEPQGDPVRKQLRKLEQQNKELRESAAKTERLERETAFLKAGINPETDPRLAYFVKGYDGQVTTEAIRAAAERDGFLSAPPPTPTPSDLSAIDTIAQAATGVPPASPTLDAELMAAETPAALMAVLQKHNRPTDEGMLYRTKAVWTRDPAKPAL